MNLGGAVRLNKLGLLVIICLVVFLFYYMSSGVTPIEKKTVNLRHLLLASIEIAERGGKEVVKARNDPNLKEMSKGKTEEGANIPVTTADIMSHCVMTVGLAELFPQIFVISEEKSKKKCSSLPVEIDDKGNEVLKSLDNLEVVGEKVVVWVDPLDATQEFTENLLDYVTTMVCVAVDGRPVIGVIHKPFGEEPKTTWAWLNQGHSPLPKPLAKREENTVIISRSHPGETEGAIKYVLGDQAKIIKAGGSGYKILELINGRASAYVHLNKIHKWDICAADAILSEMGGRFSTLTNEDIDYSMSLSSQVNGILATMDPDTHGDLADKFFKASQKS